MVLVGKKESRPSVVRYVDIIKWANHRGAIGGEEASPPPPAEQMTVVL